MPCLRSEFPRGERTFGHWEAVVEGVEPGRAYSVSVEARCELVAHPRECARLKVAWLRAPAAERPVRKQIAAPQSAAGDVWQRLEIAGVCPEGAHCARLELVSRWSAGGKILWRSPTVVEIEPPGAREVTLAAVSCPRSKTPGTNRERHLAHARSAAEAGADLVVLTEAFPRAGTGLSPFDASEPLEGPTFEAMAKVASETGAHVAGGIDELEGGTLYNTMLLVGPDGLVGRYRKTHLPESECAAGVTPGEEYPVFETPLGRVGMEICYDNFFPEVARSLAVRGAEIVLCAIAGDGREDHSCWPVVARARAIDNCVHVVASIWHPARSLIVDPWGHVLADSAGEEGFISAKVDLVGRRWCDWLSVRAQGEWRRLWPAERRPARTGISREKGKGAPHPVAPPIPYALPPGPAVSASLIPAASG